MRVVVTGATGNVGSAVVPALLADPQVTSVVGLARRVPAAPPPRFAGTEWVSCDLGAGDAPAVLRRTLAGADAVVHLAWLLQPSHRPALMERVNVGGTRAVVDAAVDVGVPALVHASSVGAYSPGPKHRRVDESWPTGGVPTSPYSRQKAAVERLLDETEARFPALRVARLRPGLIFAARAGSELARYFLGPLGPARLLRRQAIPVVPAFGRLRFQAVHTDDVGAAFAAAVTRPVSGAFNVAAEPVLDPRLLARLLGAVAVPMPAGPARALAALTWRARLQPTDPGWLDLALSVPLMDVSRAHAELGFSPRRDAASAVLDVLAGISSGAGIPTPPLAPR